MKTRELKIVLPLLIMAISSASYCGAAELQSDDSRQEKIEKLISRINELGFRQEPSDDILYNPNKVTKYWSQQHENRQKFKPQREKAKSDLAVMGDDAIEPILGGISSHAKFDLIDVLIIINSQKAKEALLDLALESRKAPPGVPFSAAKGYLKVITDKAEARKLLVSPNTNILVHSLIALRGIKIDAELFLQLKELLLFPERVVVGQAATVMVADPNSEFANEKVDIFLKYIDESYWPSRDIKSRKQRTNKDSYMWYVRCLCHVKGADEYLRALSERKFKPQTLDALMLARAHRGDISVKPEVIRIIKEAKHGNIRKIAVESFREIGTPDDVPLLRDISKTDPHIQVLAKDKMIGNMLVSNVPYDTYPVREEALRVIKLIKEKQNKKAAQ